MKLNHQLALSDLQQTLIKSLNSRHRGVYVGALTLGTGYGWRYHHKQKQQQLHDNRTVKYSKQWEKY